MTSRAVSAISLKAYVSRRSVTLLGSESFKRFSPFLLNHLSFVICHLSLSRSDLLHVLLVVFFGDFLVRDPDLAIHYFGIGLFLDQQVSRVNGFLTLANRILEHRVVEFAFLH